MNGLNDKEVLASRKKYGTNEIKVGKREGFFQLFIESLGDPIIRILLIALAIKTLFLFKDFDWYETVGIVVAIIIASLISTISEYGSSKAFERLMEESSKIKCRVRRNGSIAEIPIDEIVVGDILLLSSGDRIGADGVIIKGKIDVDESSMNGEAASVSKQTKDTVYRGCVVYNGQAEVRIEKIGNQTYYGRMVDELGEGSGSSPLKERLNSLAVLLSKIGYISAGLVSISYLFNKIIIANGFEMSKIIATVTDISLLFAYILHALTLSVTIIVVSVPEGLPMMVTLVLSSNMKRMLKNNVLVRKLVGIETAGSLNILFTDKTGTLTKGKLEVVRCLLGNGKEFTSLDEVSNRYRDILTKSLIYNNESTFDKESNQIIGGNITDKAILDFVKINRSKEVKIIKQELFDSSKKYSMVITEEGNKKVKYIKGAAEVLFSKCDRYLNEDGFKQLILDKKTLEQKIKEATNKGIRVLCVAYGEGDKDNLENLILLGFLLIKDEVREESKEGISIIKKAGIQTVMITGDNKGTALSIAKEVGIIENETKEIVLSSDELANLSDEEVINILPKLRVVSRAMPSDKSRLVNIARRCNLVVGMTGDGVNDAIALKKADVGFAMGSGTEVAKEAADIVILDDNILSIEKAILYGRTIFKSIRKFIIFQLTVNLCAVGVSIVGPFIGIPSPVTVIQMLWINMVMDTLAGLAFSYEPPLEEYMKEEPKKRDEAIINSYMFHEIMITGLYSTILCIFFLKSSWVNGIFRYSIDNKYLMTAFFGMFIFISIFNSFNARTVRLNILGNIFKNKVFIAVIGFIMVVQIGMIYYGGSLFRTTGLTPKEFIFTILMAMTVIPFDMTRKLWLKKRKIITGI
ncbi:MAG: calcium-translocating P-type ATPase, PMCA-type [Bacilli bacterium]|nr:calcium-translocating P-type ATPase, PMCA-type [Bacilli bacterium]